MFLKLLTSFWFGGCASKLAATELRCYRLRRHRHPDSQSMADQSQHNQRPRISEMGVFEAHFAFHSDHCLKALSNLDFFEITRLRENLAGFGARLKKSGSLLGVEAFL